MKRPVRAWGFRGDADELVEIERGGLRPVEAARRGQPRELVVERNRRASGREAEHQIRLVPKGIGQASRDDARGGMRRRGTR